MLRCFGMLCCFVAFCQNLSAQDNATWQLMLVEKKLSEKFTVGMEGHYRETGWFETFNQSILRPYVVYKPISFFGFSAGVSSLISGQILDGEKQTANEFNVWAELNMYHEIVGFKIRHRNRMEHRFMGNLTTDKYNFKHLDIGYRFRYRLDVSRWLGEKERWMVHVFNEYFFDWNDRFKKGSFDQNWLYLGLRRKVCEPFSVELAYLSQANLGSYPIAIFQITAVLNF
ncbi:MAG: hypothetical protein ACI9YL_001878 [Luteibaculaceae bacterium]|jgi:hypothetical protein